MVPLGSLLLFTSGAKFLYCWHGLSPTCLECSLSNSRAVFPKQFSIKYLIHSNQFPFFSILNNNLISGCFGFVLSLRSYLVSRNNLKYKEGPPASTNKISTEKKPKAPVQFLKAQLCIPDTLKSWFL